MGYKISTSLSCKQHFPYGTSFNPNNFIQETKLNIYEIKKIYMYDEMKTIIDI
jgi:hypothetical protein